MTILLKIFSALFQYDYRTVMLQPTLSKQKIVTLGSLLLIPVGLWTFAGFFISRVMKGTGLFTAILVSLVLGGIIFLVDRSFISSPRTKYKWLLGAVRLAFAVFSTVLGSLAIDMVMFSGDLEEYRGQKASDQKKSYALEYRDTHQGEVLRLGKEKERAYQRYDELAKAHQDEMDGEGGTGQKGFGKVALAKEKDKDLALQKQEKLEGQYALAMDDLELKAESHGEEMSAKRGDALLSKFKDLHEFVFKDPFTTGLYLFFFGFVFLLECFFILYKTAVSETIFETFLQAEEDYRRSEMEVYQSQKARYIKERSLLGEDHDNIRKILKASGRRKIG